MPRFTNAYLNFTGREIDLLQEGLLSDGDAIDMAEEFCNEISMPDYLFSALINRGHSADDISRAACLLSLITIKLGVCKNYTFNGFLVTIQESGTVRSNLQLIVNGVQLIHISEDLEDFGWQVLFIYDGLIDDYDVITNLLGE